MTSLYRITWDALARVTSRRSSPPLSVSSSSRFALPPAVVYRRFAGIILLLILSVVPISHALVSAVAVPTSLVPPVTSLSFVVTEDAVVKCQAQVNATLPNVKLTWLDPQNVTSNVRMQVQATTTRLASSDAVLITATLTIRNLSIDDSGVYRCVASHSNGTESSQSQVSIQVRNDYGGCGFESSELCRWTVVDGTAAEWIWHNCSSDEITHGDHTYRSPGVAGHYMKFQSVATGSSVQQVSSSASASLVSPTIPRPLPVTKQCFTFWYIAEGDVVLNVQMKTANNESSIGPTILKIIDPTTPVITDEGSWKQATISLEPSPNADYQIVLEASVINCSACNNISVYIDDVSLTSVDCNATAIGAATGNSRTAPPPVANVLISDLTLSISSSSTLATSTTIVTNVNNKPATKDQYQSSANSSLLSYPKTSQLSMSTTTTATLTPTPTPTTTAPPTTTTTTTVTATTTATTTTASSTTTAVGGGAIPGQAAAGEGQDRKQETDSTPDIRSPASVGSTTEGVVEGVPNVIETTEDESASDDSNGGSNNTGLAIGIVLAVMSAGACTAAVLYRRKRRGRKSTYITFGNPSYSREHLPANDFSLDSPLTLSSNGYTVLA